MQIYLVFIPGHLPEESDHHPHRATPHLHRTIKYLSDLSLVSFVGQTYPCLANEIQNCTGNVLGIPSALCRDLVEQGAEDVSLGAHRIHITRDDCGYAWLVELLYLYVFCTHIQDLFLPPSRKIDYISRLAA
jgi:hypothetical protein